MGIGTQNLLNNFKAIESLLKNTESRQKFQVFHIYVPLVALSSSPAVSCISLTQMIYHESTLNVPDSLSPSTGLWYMVSSCINSLRKNVFIDF